MPFAQLDNIKLYYEIHGEGFPLVCIAGISADHMGWISVIGLLAKKYKVIVFDNRGVGQSDVPAGPYSIEQMSEDTYKLCQYLGLKEAIVMGSSMGGYITQQLMRSYPQFVRAGIMVDSTQCSRSSFNLFFEGQLELMQAEAPLSSRVKLTLSLLYSSEFLSIPGRVDQLIELRANYPYAATEAGMRAQFAALKAFNSSDWIQEIHTPSLVIGGGQDLIFDEATIKALAQAMPQARYHSFPEAGHLPHQEAPQEFVQVVDSFIQTALLPKNSIKA